VRTLLRLAVVIVAFAGVVRPFSAEACACGGTISSSVAFSAADIVFVGTVARSERPKPQSRVNADGSGTGWSGSGPQMTILDVGHLFRGGVRGRS
jgi:hypothetical protein